MRPRPQASPYQAHKRNPLDLLRRQLDKAPGKETEEDAHVRLWMKDIEAQVGDDPRQQAVTRSAIVAYLALQRLEATLLQRKPDSDKYADMAIEATRLAERVAKLLRLAGLKGRKAGKTDLPREGTVFSPPRPRSVAEAEPLEPDLKGSASDD